MVNKKLMALAVIFLLLAIGSHAYIRAHPEPVEPDGFTLEELLDGMELRTDGQIQYNLDSVGTENTVVSLYGWALMEGHSTEFTNVVIGLRDTAGNLRLFTTEKIARTDVSAAFDNSLYEGSGFSAECNMNGLPEGNYTVVLYLTDAKLDAYYTLDLPGNVTFDGLDIAYLAA